MRESYDQILPSRAHGVHAMQAAARVEVQELEARVRRAAHSGADALSSLQFEPGYWSGHLTADATLESDWVLLQLWMHPPDASGWNPPSLPRLEKAVRTILERQLPDGGWNIYSGGPSEVNATARAYIAMKLTGADPNAPAMSRARNRVLALGGLQACNSYTKINLSLFGLYPRQYVPSIPPELLLVPGNLLYEMSSWTRGIIVPLSIVQAAGGIRPAPPGFTIDELFDPDKKLALPKREGLSQLFNQADRLVKVWERRGIKDVRKSAIREAEHWMLDRVRFTDGLGAIYPAMMYSIMAMESLGYERDHPDLLEAIGHFENLILETEDRFQFQPAVSPVWDTAIAMFALGEAGHADPARLTRAADWLLAKEIRRKGDWAVKRPGLTPGGWAFEFANEYYPDIDDTAMVLLALLHAKASDPERQARAERRAIEWIFGMQSSDGGWAAFDVDNNWQLLNKVPFADHNAMLDPTCPDITGRVIESLSRRGYTSTAHPAVRRGVQYLIDNQKSDGSWYGRWGVNYIYGTFLAIRGLYYSQAPEARPAIQKGENFLRATQNSDGGWGESCVSYEVHKYVQGPSSASQTAWALLGLAASDSGRSPTALRGVQFLLDTQRPDGTWEESSSTGTGFPNVFYLTYHLYRQYFPVLALAACR
jgi:squalene-hopene/tetraprenyl-beta-curcumene cyclase